MKKQTPETLKLSGIFKMLSKQKGNHHFLVNIYYRKKK